MEKVEQLSASVLDAVKLYGPKVIYAIITLLIGLWIIKSITKLFSKVLVKRGVDDSLSTFLKSFISITLKALLVISVIGMVGVQTTSFIALIGAAGLAVGMALSGMLQNFAGGVIILIMKPFKVGDFISAQGESGIVKEIQIFNTILKTPDNKTIILPNGGLSTGSLTNFTLENTRRVDFTFGISYTDSIDKARDIILSVIAKNDKVINDPEPFVRVIELGDNSVNLVVRIWANTSDYWDVFFYMQETVKKEFDAQGISIPFPQRDVHIYNTEK